MDDERIVMLFWDRDEQAICAASDQYGAYCRRVAANILDSSLDVEECLNDTWLHAWNSIPPAKPRRLRTFLGKLTRNLALNKWRYHSAQKRSGQVQALVEELEDCVSDPQLQLEQKELTACLNDYLSSLSRKKRKMFIARYWYMEPISALSQQFGISEAAVTMQLKRLREKLRIHLTERGHTL